MPPPAPSAEAGSPSAGEPAGDQLGDAVAEHCPEDGDADRPAEGPEEGHRRGGGTEVGLGGDTGSAPRARGSASSLPRPRPSSTIQMRDAPVAGCRTSMVPSSRQTRGQRDRPPATSQALPLAGPGDDLRPSTMLEDDEESTDHRDRHDRPDDRSGVLSARQIWKYWREVHGAARTSRDRRRARRSEASVMVFLSLEEPQRDDRLARLGLDAHDRSSASSRTRRRRP